MPGQDGTKSVRGRSLRELEGAMRVNPVAAWRVGEKMCNQTRDRKLIVFALLRRINGHKLGPHLSAL